MIRRKTVLILGAGASWHLGYPTGEELVRGIIRTIENSVVDHPQIPRLQQRLNEFAMMESFADMLDSHAAKNIDLFLNSSPEFSEIGRILIINELLKREKLTRSGALQLRSRNIYNWYGILKEALMTDLSAPDDFLKNQLSIITFNYDISLDYFLNKTLRETSFIKGVVDEYLNKLEIIHIYGKIDNPYDDYGRYGKQSTTGNDTMSYYQARKLKDGIHVIGEQKQNELQEDSAVLRAKELIKDAERAFIFGYGFDKNNSRLIRLNSLNDLDKEVYCTNYGDSQTVETEIKKLCSIKLFSTKPPIITAKGVYEALSEANFNLES